MKILSRCWWDEHDMVDMTGRPEFWRAEPRPHGILQYRRKWRCARCGVEGWRESFREVDLSEERGAQ